MTLLLSPPQTQVQTELEGVVVVGVKNEGIDLGDLHDLAVGSSVGAGLEDLALGSPMGVKALLRENDAAALTVEQELGTVDEPRQHLQVLEGDDGGVVVGGGQLVVPEIGVVEILGVGMVGDVPGDLSLLGGQLVEEDQHITGLVVAQRLVFVHGHGPEVVDGDEDPHMGVDGGGGLPGHAESRGVLGHVLLQGHLPRVGPDVARVHLVAHDHAHDPTVCLVLTGVAVGEEGDEGAVVRQTLLGDQVEGRDQTRAILGLTRVGGVLDDIPEGGVDVAPPMGGIEQDEGDHTADLGQPHEGLVHPLHVGLAEVEHPPVVLELNGVALLVGGHEEIALVDVDGGMAHTQFLGVLVVHHLQALLGVHHGVGEIPPGCGDGLHVLLALQQLVVHLHPVGQAHAVTAAGKAGDHQCVTLYSGGQGGQRLHLLGQNGGEGKDLHLGVGGDGGINKNTDGIGGRDDRDNAAYSHDGVRPFSVLAWFATIIIRYFSKKVNQNAIYFIMFSKCFQFRHQNHSLFVV